MSNRPQNFQASHRILRKLHLAHRQMQHILVRPHITPKEPVRPIANYAKNRSANKQNFQQIFDELFKCVEIGVFVIIGILPRYRCIYQTPLNAIS